MKLLPRFVASLSIAIFAAAPGAHAEPSPVSVRVEQVGKASTEKTKKTQSKALKMTVTNNSQADVSVKLKYTIFGKEMVGHDIVALDSGVKEATIKPRMTETIETPSVSAISEEAHTDKKTKVPASGTKMFGYAVQTMIGDKIVAEAYEPPSAKEALGTAVGVPKKK